MNIKKIIPREQRIRIMNLLHFLPDKIYISLFYFFTTGRILNLRNPKLFSEKQQWLKLNDKHLEYSLLVDKLSVKEYVDKLIGTGHTFPLIGKWKNFDDIDFSALPNQFVLKCNHDSGSTRVIKDKSNLTVSDIEELRTHFKQRLKSDFFYAGREYQYKGIEPYIIAETFMVDKKHPEEDVEDYKFFCFDGVPKLMFVATDRSKDCRFDFYDMDFNWMNIQNLHPNSGKTIEKPAKFEEMKKIASILSRGIKFVRIDLYCINETIYFGEYTFYHGGGYCLFYPMKWERKLGDWIVL